jgi:hypothetical protein
VGISSRPYHVDADGMGVEEVLVLRVVDEAHRRRVRRAVVAVLLAVVAGSGVAIAVTHRSGAGSNLASRVTPGRSDEPTPVDIQRDRSQWPAIYAAARARYAEALRAQGSTHLEFGQLTVNGSQARLLVNFVCVPLCGHGEEVTLRKTDGRWRVVGVRTSWVS